MNAPAGNTSPFKSDHPLVELTLTRLRLFFREPGAVFWTFGFPLLLTVALGAAFRNRPPEPVAIGVESEPLAETLRRDPGLRVQVLDNDGAARVALRTRPLLKRLVATPMSRAHFLMSFVLMRALFLFLELPVLLGFGWLTFRVGVAGSLPLLLGVAILADVRRFGRLLLDRALPRCGAALPAHPAADGAQRRDAGDHDRRRRPARRPRTGGAARRHRRRLLRCSLESLPVALNGPDGFSVRVATPADTCASDTARRVRSALPKTLEARYSSILRSVWSRPS